MYFLTEKIEGYAPCEGFGDIATINKFSKKQWGCTSISLRKNLRDLPCEGFGDAVSINNFPKNGLRKKVIKGNKQILKLVKYDLPNRT